MRALNRRNPNQAMDPEKTRDWMIVNLGIKPRKGGRPPNESREKDIVTFKKGD